MNVKNKWLVLIAAIISVLAVAGCTAIPITTPTVADTATAVPTLAPSATPLPSDTPVPPTDTLTATTTFTPTLTPTPTDTLTPTITPTTTLTPSKTVAYNLPGLHQVNLCGRTSFHYSDSRSLDLNGPYNLTMDLCVTTVLVNNDGTMKFNMEWRLVTWDGPLPSRYMYAAPDFVALADDLGNDYGRIGDSGPVVDNDVVGGKENTYIGWYLFPAPKAGATTFTLFDTLKKVTIVGIKLRPGK